MAKRFLTLALAALMIMSMLVTGASAGNFTDVDASNEALTEAVDLLATLGITKGTTDTTFGTNENVTRQQMAAFIYRLMKAGRSVEGGENLTKFTDLNDSTFYFMISWASDQGIIKGTTNTTFNPLGGIKLQDAYTMIVRALGYEKDETLPYPIGYIDIAEQIGLSENIPSTVDYSDELTRGDVAILLYNAFYADMNEDITVDNYVEIAGVPVNFPKTVKATVATKIFKVSEVTAQVVATPNYALDANAVTKAELNDIELVTLAGGINETVAFSTLGLDGEADDYFLSTLTLFVRDEKVVAAKSNIATATGKIEFGRIAEKNVKVEDQKLSGYFTVGNLKGYFYDAPASFLKDGSYAKFIGLTGGADTESFEYETDKFDNGNDAAIFDTTLVKNDANYTAAADQFTTELYEATAYDVDGNGTIDYLWYKPYTFGQVILDDEKDTDGEYKNTLVLKHTSAATWYAPVTVEGVPSIYTQGAVMVGTASNEAWMLGYVNAKANYIAVGAIVKPVEGKVKMVASDKTVTLITGEKFTTDLTLNPGDEGVFFIYEGELLRKAGIETADAEMDYTAPIAVILDKDVKQPEGQIVNGEYVEGAKFIKVYVDGAIKYVQAAEKDADNLAIDVEEVAEALENQVVFYTVNANGEYIFTGIDYAKYNNTAVLAGTEEGKIYAAKKAASTMVKAVGNIYKFSADVIPSTYAAVATDARILVKSLDKENEVIFTLYTADDLPSFAEDLTFENLQYVLVNNTASTTIESLGLLYAEVDGQLAFTTDEIPEVRIVGSHYAAYDEEKDATVYYYTVFNPLTGEITNDVAGENTSAAAAFAVYEVAGTLKDKVAASASLAKDSDDLDVITAYDAAAALVEIDGNLFKVDDKTVVTFIDRSDVKFEKLTLAALDPTAETYQETDGKLYAYINATAIEGVTLYKHLDFAVIVID